VRRTEPRALLIHEHEPTSRGELIEEIYSSPIARHFHGINNHFTGGRKLTEKGNLALVDARKLVQDLETGDRLEHKIDRVYKVRSATELPRLMGIMELAGECKVIRTQQGKIFGTKAWGKVVRTRSDRIRNQLGSSSGQHRLRIGGQPLATRTRRHTRLHRRSFGSPLRHVVREQVS
jgi:hypothetical protein